MLEYPTLLEPATENPFLDRYYREGRRHALPTQLFFLLHRARQMADIGGSGLVGNTLIADFLMEKDDLFARLTLDENEYCAVSTDPRKSGDRSAAFPIWSSICRHPTTSCCSGSTSAVSITSATSGPTT